MIKPFVMGSFVMGPFVMGPLVIGPYVFLFFEFQEFYLLFCVSLSHTDFLYHNAHH